MSCCVSYLILAQLQLTFLFSTDFSADNSDYESDASQQEDISLGSHDTDIGEEEFEEIEHEGTMPSKSAIEKNDTRSCL